MTTSPRAFVIGHPVAHSRSPLIHGHWLKQCGIEGSYEKVDVAPAALAEFVATIRGGAFVGGNVTVPHKTAILSLVDEVDAAGQAIGAVNTLWMEGGRLMAGNTDALGFLGNLDAAAPGWDETAGRALVLGAGGAARAIVYGLLERGFEVCVVNRTLMKGVELADAFDDDVWAYAWEELPGVLSSADLLVNTTSLGMAGMPRLDLDLAGLKRGALVTDIVYVPLETELLRKARERGHRTVDGLGMLLHQAVPGFERWFGVRPQVTAEWREVVEADISR